jgi:hypothetical protein
MQVFLILASYMLNQTMKFLATFILFSLFIFNAAAQNFRFGDITSEDYAINRNAIDSNANAIVIQEFGRATMQLNESDNRLHLIFEYHIKLKIFNKDGFRQGNIIVPLYKGQNQ